MHAHIIYGVDDGAQSIEESIHLIKMAYQQGVKKIIATPHSYSTIGVEIMKKRLSVLQKMLANDLPEMELFFGEEILYSVEVGKSRNINTCRQSICIGGVSACDFLQEYAPQHSKLDGLVLYSHFSPCRKVCLSEKKKGTLG